MKEKRSEACDLVQKKCKPCEGGGVKPFNREEVTTYLKKLKGWEVKKGNLYKKYSFKNYYQTISFVNAIAWVANKENHHPDITFGYKECEVRFMTHAVNGLTENDFISAAKVDQLLND